MIALKLVCKICSASGHYAEVVGHQLVEVRDIPGLFEVGPWPFMTAKLAYHAICFNMSHPLTVDPLTVDEWVTYFNNLFMCNILKFHFNTHDSS